MSSTLRTRANNSGVLQPVGVVALTYNGNAVVPFTLNKQTGVLDFDFSTGFSASQEIGINDTVYVRGSNFSSLYNVNDIGPNIKAWCVTYVGATAGTVQIYEKPIVVKANQISFPRIPETDNTMAEDTNPITFDNSSGNNTTSYYTTYLFKKPLVVTYLVGGQRRYRMFNTQFSSGQT